MPKEIIEKKCLDQLFNNAHTYHKWQNKEVSDDILQKIYDLAKLPPTSANCQPMRIFFVKSPEKKNLLLECMAEGNVEKTKTAPVTAIIAWDEKFYDHLPKLYPHVDAKSWFSNNAEFANNTAFRNSSLQGAYFIMAVRALGLDAGPMSGFNADKVNEKFFANLSYKVNLICNIGYGADGGYYDRSPRPEFNEFCKII